MSATKKATRAPVKKAPAKKAARATAKGDSYECVVCGLAITVDEDCGCVETCDIFCCDQPMKQRKPRAKAATKLVAKATKATTK